MSHVPGNFADLGNGWSMTGRSPGVEEVVASTSGGDLELHLEIEFSSGDPVLIRFEGGAATAELSASLDMHIANHSGEDWGAFNVTLVDQLKQPGAGDAAAGHPFYSHFHDVPAATSNHFTRYLWDSVEGTFEDGNPGNALEFWRDIYRNDEADTLDLTGFELHQVPPNSGPNGTGGTFFMVLTPDVPHIDYSGYGITEDYQNQDFLRGDFFGSAPRKDMLFGYNGDDLMEGGALDDRLYGGSGNDELYGGAGDDALSGSVGNDLLVGGARNDTMRGGLGNDTYSVDSSSDRVFEARGQGTDHVEASARYALAAGQAIETVSTTRDAGKAKVDLTGNEFAQSITGNDGINTLEGRGGNDVLRALGGHDNLYGGLGNDKLYGGLGGDNLRGSAGKDIFVFDTRPSTSNIDHVRDFKSVDDTIWLDQKAFGKLTHPGTLSSTVFKDITDPAVQRDEDDRIYYNHDTGRLSYDPDGSGSTPMVTFAILDTSPLLTNTDFQVV